MARMNDVDEFFGRENYRADIGPSSWWERHPVLTQFLCGVGGGLAGWALMRWLWP